MNLTQKQKMIINIIWNELRYRLINFAITTRPRNETIVNGLHIIKNDMSKSFSNYTEHEKNMALEFITFVIDTAIFTTSITKTIQKVEEKYKFLQKQ